MLDQAKSKGVYDELIRGDLIDALEHISGQYDLILAMDVLVFFGDLEAIFMNVGRILRPQGVFAFDLEKGFGTALWQLHIYGNYVHTRRYISELAQRCGYTEVLCDEMEIRKEVNTPVVGYLVFLRANP